MKFFLIFVLGAAIGSFLNVCIYRIPRGKSIVWPGSYCPGCGKPVRPFDNIPLISFLFLRARCRDCGFRIPVRYFFVELLTALSGIALLFYFPDHRSFFVYWLFTCLLIAIVFIDIEHQIVPDVLSIPGIFIGLILVSFFLNGKTGFSQEAFVNSLLGIFAGGGSIFFTGFLGELIFRREAMGGGDVKLMAMIGAFIGWELVLLTFFMAPVLGLGFALVARFKEKKREIPYAPHLAMGALISLLYGESILRYVLP